MVDTVEAKLTKRLINGLEAKEKRYDVNDSLIQGFHLRVYGSGKMSFYFTYRNIERKRKRIKIGSLGSMTVEQARDEAKQLAAQAVAGIDVQKEKLETRQAAIEQQNNTLGAYLEDRYKPWVLTHHKRGKETLRSIEIAFPEFMPLPLHEITAPVIEKWRINRKQKKGDKNNTINRKVNLLKGALSRAVEWKVIKDHPFKGMKDLKVDKNPKVRYLSDDEHQRLISALNERDKDLKQSRERYNAHLAQRHYELLPSLSELAFADRMMPMVLLSLKTGMRQGEVFNLAWRDINFDKSYVTVIGANAKSSMTRHIPLSATAIDVLTQWRKQAPKRKPGDRVFPAEDGGRLNNVKRSWATILELADITNFRWHDMRHDFASQLVMKGVPLNTVRELCGHASMDTTLRYAHLAPDHKQEAVDLLG